jgi:transcriptional regulator with XRE-family HTH domain
MLPLVSSTGATLLRNARVQAGLSRRALAAKADVPTSTVSRVEDGRSDPTVTMLERLLMAAGAQLVAGVVANNGTPTLAALATAVEKIDGRLKIDWTRLRGFADWAAQHPEALQAAIADPPTRTGTPLDAILAALAEQLALDHHAERPRWARAVGRLHEEWSPPATPKMRAAAADSTAEPFRRRNLVLAKSALFRQAV